MQDLLQLLAIASAVVLGIFVVHYFRYRTVVAQVTSNASESDAGPQHRHRLQREVDVLRTRVEVLERIVTDQVR